MSKTKTKNRSVPRNAPRDFGLVFSVCQGCKTENPAWIHSEKRECHNCKIDPDLHLNLTKALREQYNHLAKQWNTLFRESMLRKMKVLIYYAVEHGKYKSYNEACHKLYTQYAMRGIKSSLRDLAYYCLLYTSPSPRDRTRSRMPSSA